MFRFDPNLPLLPRDLPSVAIAITMSYFSYCIHKGMTFKESLQNIGIEPPSGVPDSWNLVHIADIANITVTSDGVKISTESKLQTFFVAESNEDILDD
tara:strand:+ start:380 stop:673 length:294 start_codon:yes stop_codon:yes gene_type:complete